MQEMLLTVSFEVCPHNVIIKKHVPTKCELVKRYCTSIDIGTQRLSKNNIHVADILYKEPLC